MTGIQIRTSFPAARLSRGPRLRYPAMCSPPPQGSDAFPSMEKARLHHATRRRDGSLAARSARAAGGKASYHRVLWAEHGLCLEAVDRCFWAAAARTRLD